MPETSYILGHSHHEVRRLMLQAAILQPITERLLRAAGIARGMRVLDLGCGAGDVALLAAALVGPSGSVVGIDQNAEVLDIARQRAQEAGLSHLEFRDVPVEALSDPEPFDLVVGRYVLIHQPDPVAFIRSAANLVRTGGVVAFQELCIERGILRSHPHVSLWQAAGEWIVRAFQTAAPHCDAGGRLVEHFARARLAQPALFCECPVGGGEESPFYAWVAATLESVIPHLLRKQLVTADAIGIETFEDRLRTAVVEAQSQLIGAAQFCAWTRVA